MEPRKLYSLVFVRKGTQVLLGMKKFGFGAGKWNGFGGKIKKKETILQGAIREVREECGLSVTDLKKVAILEAKFVGEEKVHEVHIFETYQYDGVITESNEMQPKWFENNDIPYHQMWPDNKEWYPLILERKLLRIYVLYQGVDELLERQIKVVEELP